MDDEIGYVLNFNRLKKEVKNVKQYNHRINQFLGHLNKVYPGYDYVDSSTIKDFLSEKVSIEFYDLSDYDYDSKTVVYHRGYKEHYSRCDNFDYHKEYEKSIYTSTKMTNDYYIGTNRYIEIVNYPIYSFCNLKHFSNIIDKDVSREIIKKLLNFEIKQKDRKYFFECRHNKLEADQYFRPEISDHRYYFLYENSNYIIKEDDFNDDYYVFFQSRYDDGRIIDDNDIKNYVILKPFSKFNYDGFLIIYDNSKIKIKAKSFEEFKVECENKILNNEII
jgi:hypothetical protein